MWEDDAGVLHRFWSTARYFQKVGMIAFEFFSSHFKLLNQPSFFFKVTPDDADLALGLGTDIGPFAGFQNPVIFAICYMRSNAGIDDLLRCPRGAPSIRLVPLLSLMPK